MIEIFSIVGLIFLAKQSIWTFVFSALSIIISVSIGSKMMLVWLPICIIGCFMWYTSLGRLNDKIKVRSLTLIQFGVVVLAFAAGAFALILLGSSESGIPFLGYMGYEESIFLVGAIIIAILIALRYRSLWSISLLSYVFIPMIIWITTGNADAYTDSPRRGGIGIIFAYFFRLMESSPVYAKMWLLKLVIYVYGMFQWERASKKLENSADDYLDDLPEENNWKGD